MKKRNEKKRCSQWKEKMFQQSEIQRESSMKVRKKFVTIFWCTMLGSGHFLCEGQAIDLDFSDSSPQNHHIVRYEPTNPFA